MLRCYLYKLYTTISESIIHYQTAGITFEFVAATNEVVADHIFTKLRASLFHTLIVDESNDIAVHKVLVLYFKYRFPNLLIYKTVFGGIIQLTACHAPALEQAIKEFYNEDEIDINCLVMLTFDGTSAFAGSVDWISSLQWRLVPMGCSPPTRFYDIFFSNFYNVDIFYNVIVHDLFTNAPVYVAEKTNCPILLALN